MGRKRTKNLDLPKYMRRSKSSHYYEDPKTRECTTLAPLDDYAGALKALALILQANAPTNTLEQLWAKYQIDVLPSLAKKTRTNRKQQMKRPLAVFGKMSASDIEPHHAWTFWRKRGETEQAKKEIRAMSALLTYARQVGARKTDNPWFKLGLSVKGQKARPYVTDAMFYAVRDIAPPMLGYAMDLAWCAGLDGATIRRIERRNITDTGLLFERGKTGKLQEINGPDLVEILRSALRLPPQLRRFVICSRGGKPYGADGFQSAWQDAIAKAIKLGRLTKEQRYHFHDLRGKAASEAASDEAAKNLLGHGDVKVTMIYRHLPQRGEALRILGKDRK